MPGILNTEVIKQRRLELGLSQRELARRIRVSSTGVTALEQGTNHHTLTLRIVSDLATALSTPLDLLLAPPDQSPRPAPDDVSLEAALLSARGARPAVLVARVLGWPRSRVDQAAVRLAERYASTGATLAQTAHGLQIQPRPGVLTVEMPDAKVTRGARTRRGLTAYECRLLVVACAPGGVRHRHIGTNQSRVATGHLRRLGYLDEIEAGHRAAAEVRSTFAAVNRFARGS